LPRKRRKRDAHRFTGREVVLAVQFDGRREAIDATRPRLNTRWGRVALSNLQ